jgi:Domain of unknown function (DUF3883)
MNIDWSYNEVELIVGDYFSMLVDELKNIPINKASHRKSLMPLLNNRSDGSVEFKHQNISAVLLGMGLPFIKGYKPRFNFQKDILISTVQNYLIKNPNIEYIFSDFADRNDNPYLLKSFDNWAVDPPVNDKSERLEQIRRPIKINYLEREQNNRLLGLQGEELALQYERFLLINNGRGYLADKVEWVSKEQGDGLGFDILSRNFNGTDKYIEVKTTKLGKEAPFFFSANEYNFSQQNFSDYHLYRIFDFANIPKIFVLSGSFDSFCKVEAVNYKGIF